MKGLPEDQRALLALFERVRRALDNLDDITLNAEVSADLRPLLEEAVRTARRRVGPIDEACRNIGSELTLGVFLTLAVHGARFTVPYGVQLLGDPIPFCRWFGARTISLSGMTVDGGPRDILLGMLKDESLKIRAEAVRALACTAAAEGRDAVEALVRSVDQETIEYTCELMEQSKPPPGLVISVILDLVPFVSTSEAFWALLRMAGDSRAREAIPQLERLADLPEAETKLPALAALYRVTRKRAARRLFWRALETALTGVLAIFESRGGKWSDECSVLPLDRSPDGRLLSVVDAMMNDAARFPEPPDTLIAKIIEALTAAPAILRLGSADFLRRARVQNATIAEGLVEAFTFGMNEQAGGYTVNTAEVVIALYHRYRDEARKLRFLITQCCSQLVLLEGFDPESSSYEELRRIEARLRRDPRSRD